MEYLLCGVPLDLPSMVKYIERTEEVARVEEVEEVRYTLKRYQIVLSNYKSLKIPGENSTKLSVVYPSDKNKSRKSLCRKKSVTEFSGDLCRFLEELGCKKQGSRKYLRTVYKYKGVEVIIAEKNSKELVVVRSEHREESILEEVKERLKLWVALEVPPEQIEDLVV